MKVNVDGNEVYFSTGGRAHADGRPFVMFLHGAGFNHLTWPLQVRAMAYDGYNVIAADMPGHGLSSGEPIEGIEAQAVWALKLLDAAGAKDAIVVGHSQGGLIALEMASQAPERVKAIAFVATAAAIPVNGQLIAQAEKDPHGAYANMLDWAHGQAAHMHDNTWPGASHLNYGVHVMEMGNPQALVADLKSCTAYEGGEKAASSLKVPAMVVLAEQDRMTPAKFGRSLAKMIPDCELHVIGGSGHTIPTEKPRELNALLRAFLKRAEATEAV